MNDRYYRPFLLYEVIGDTLFAVELLVLGQGKIVMGKDQSSEFDVIWHYDLLADAVIAFRKWNKETEPEPKGWAKRKPEMEDNDEKLHSHTKPQ